MWCVVLCCAVACCVVLCCGVLCCVVLWRVVLCVLLFMFGNGFPSRFVHFSFVASLSFRVWPAEVHRITGAGRQSTVRQTELIIGIRDVHNEVSAWTLRTTLRWWTASKTTCSTAHEFVRHLAGKILQGVVAAEGKLRECVLADKINLHSPPPFLETLQHSLL